MSPRTTVILTNTRHILTAAHVMDGPIVRTECAAGEAV